MDGRATATAIDRPSDSHAVSNGGTPRDPAHHIRKRLDAGAKVAGTRGLASEAMQTMMGASTNPTTGICLTPCSTTAEPIGTFYALCIPRVEVEVGFIPALTCPARVCDDVIAAIEWWCRRSN